MPDINIIWPRIEANAGEAFYQIRGERFNYAFFKIGLY